MLWRVTPGKVNTVLLAGNRVAGNRFAAKVNLTRWGNSLGLGIPKELASRFRLAEGARVDIAAEGDRLVTSHVCRINALARPLAWARRRADADHGGSARKAGRADRQRVVPDKAPRRPRTGTMTQLLRFGQSGAIVAQRMCDRCLKTQ